jgi:hypothetical protein
MPDNELAVSMNMFHLGALLVTVTVGLSGPFRQREVSSFVRDEGPVPATTAFPDYPTIAISACVQGSVPIVVEIGTRGEVLSTDIVHGHPLLRYVADQAIRRWTFHPDADDQRRRQVVTFTFVLTETAPNPKSVLKSPTWVEVRASGTVIRDRGGVIDVVATRDRNAKCFAVR